MFSKARAPARARGGSSAQMQQWEIDIEAVPSSMAEIILPILRVADEVEPTNLRVAYLCRFHAFEESHRLDPISRRQGVRQFKTALLQRLERENNPTLMGRVYKSDAREIQSFYQHYIQNVADKADRAKLTTANVLFEVLKAINQTRSVEVNHESQIDIAEIIVPILRVADEVEPTNQRVAYLCRFYAFEEAHRLDRTCSRLGVRQFKIALLQRLERENDPTLMGRVNKSDAREMQSFYQHYIKNVADKADRAQLTTANVLFEVLKAVNQTQSPDFGST